MGAVTVKIENDYEDGSHSERLVLVAQGPTSIEDEAMIEWFEERIWPLTGDGTGEHMSACYTATIVSAEEAQYVGEWKEWV